MNLGALSGLLTRAKALRASYYRIVDSRCVAEIDEIAHAVLYSWRYNPKGEFGVLYLSASPGCCWREKLKQVLGRATDLPPQSVGRFDVNLSKCLDITDTANRSMLAVTLDDLPRPSPFTPTQELARQARRSGFEAIIAPAAVGDDCHNLVVFKDKLTPPSSCTLDMGSIQSYP